MNYPNLPSAKRPPRKSNFVLLLVMGFMAFFLYTQYKKAQVGIQADRGANTPQQQSDGVADFSIPDISNDVRKPVVGKAQRDQDGVPIGANSGGNGDWELDTDVAIEKDQSSYVIGSDHGRPDERTTSGDWEMEVSASQESSSGTAVQAPPNAKSTTEGNWELSEVEVEKSK